MLRLNRNRKRSPIKSYYQFAKYKSWRKSFDGYCYDSAKTPLYRSVKRSMKHYEKLAVQEQIDNYLNELSEYKLEYNSIYPDDEFEFDLIKYFKQLLINRIK